MATLTKAELAEQIYEQIGLSRVDGMRIICQVFDLISSELSAGNAVKISGFASFETKLKNQRIGRNPKTGEEAMIPPRRVVSFKSSSSLRSKLNP